MTLAENEAQGKWALPDGWVWTTLGECAQVITGTTPSKKDPSNYGDYLPLVKPPQLNDDLIYDAEDKLSEKGVKLARVLPPQSVLVSCIGILGKTGINGVSVAFNQQINAVVFPSEIMPRYGFYYLQSAEVKRWLYSIASATTVTIVNKSKFQRTCLPLAPLPEQRRIVAEIETQFTRLDAAVVALKRVQANIRRYKAAVLKAACEGRLVPTEAELARAEGRDYEPACQLLARILAERRARWEAEHPGKRYKEPAPPDTESLPDLPEGWVWASLEQLSWNSRYGTSQKCTYDVAGPPVLRIPNISNGRFDLGDVKLGTKPDELERIDPLAPNDLLIIRTNGSRDLIGRSALVRNPFDRPTYFASYLIRFRLVDTDSLSLLVAAIWDAPMMREWIERVAATSAGQYNINIGSLNHLPIPLSPTAEQHRLVAEVERRLSVVAALEASVVAALARAGRLRQAVLKQAFEGRLVAQDPDDEPASVLLERIRAQRAARTPAKGKHKGKQMRLPTV